MNPVYVVDGARTPFLKSKNRPGPFAAADLATQRDLVARVVRVDDFGQDLGTSLLIPIGQDAAPQQARATSAPEVRRAVA